MRSLAAPSAIDPIGNMFLFGIFSGEGRPVMPIAPLGIVTNALRGPAGHHLGCSGNMFDGAVTPEQPLAQAVMAVAERGLPRDNCVCGIFERNPDRVRPLAAVFLLENTPGHKSRARLRQIERGHDSSNLA